MAQHTPGQWEVLPLDTGKYYGTVVQIGRNGGKVTVWTCDEGPTAPSQRELADGWCEDYGFDHVETAECLANACLIAAAPDLLRALEGILPSAGWANYSDEELLDEAAKGNETAPRILNARAAIAKARNT